MPVTREQQRRTSATILVAGLLAVTGCSGSPEAAPAPAPATASATPTTRDQPTATPTPKPSASAPEAGSMAEPGTSSGSLTRHSFPTPRALGAGWRYSVDPGDAEEGYAGNGTPALARRPEEVVQTAVPFGCARRTAMPAPTHALEVDYTLHGARVIAVRGRFADAARARAFFAGRASNLRGCDGHSASAAIGPLVANMGRPAAGALVSDRTPRSDPWRELAVLDGDTVVLLAAQGRAPLTDPQTRRLVRLFRS